MTERKELFADYSPELRSAFSSFIDEANEFVRRNQGKVATIHTPEQTMQEYVQDLIKLGRALVSGVRTIKTENYSAVYESVLNPSRESLKVEGEPKVPGYSDYAGMEGPGFVRHGKTRYHILEKVIYPKYTFFPRTLLVMLQRVPRGLNTRDEIHGVKIQDGMLTASKYIGGIEMHVPLQKDTSFWNNGKKYYLEPLDGLLTLPGDIHSLGGERWPSKNIIIMAFGAGLGQKVDEDLISRGIQVNSVVKSLPLPDYSMISRYSDLRT